jgi:DNA-binding NtrC family response regulator
MKKPSLAIIDADTENGQQFCAFLEKLNYSTSLFTSLEDMEGYLEHDPEIAAILDLDSIEVKSQVIRALKKRHPQLHILGVSKLLLHPGLEEIIGSHLYACLVKPLDEEELLFWLKSIAENLENPAAVTDF